jgi:hypothetical protein
MPATTTQISRHLVAGMARSYDKFTIRAGCAPRRRLVTILP